MANSPTDNEPTRFVVESKKQARAALPWTFFFFRRPHPVTLLEGRTAAKEADDYEGVFGCVGVAKHTQDNTGKGISHLI